MSSPVSWEIVTEGSTEGLCIDDALDYPDYQWQRSAGVWSNYLTGGGDIMIRAFMDSDTSQHPNMVIAPSEIEEDADGDRQPCS